MISEIHGRFHFPLVCIHKTLELKNLLLRKPSESSDTRTVKEFQYWGRKSSLYKNMYLGN